MPRALRVLTQSLLLTCPACQHGNMFRSGFRMNVRCPVCHVVFERDSGELTGGLAINATLTMAIAMVGAGFAFSPEVPIIPLVLLLAGIVVLFPLVFYRHARGLWVGILYLTGSMFED
ncbi:DUF983 domain-containing protein [Chloroflexia bacterium SDU3-3]|nr:DUF983 domain-containing protein [Chloroflexia bacterium SDU3-3]